MNSLILYDIERLSSKQFKLEYITSILWNSGLCVCVLSQHARPRINLCVFYFLLKKYWENSDIFYFSKYFYFYLSKKILSYFHFYLSTELYYFLQHCQYKLDY